VSHDDVVVGFPWRETPDRVPAFRVVFAWYRHHLPGARMVCCDSGHDPFNRAASRNMVVDRAVELGAAVVVISDADTVPSPAGLSSAIAAARNGGMHYPFDRYLYAGTDLEPGGNTGGIYVCRPDVWHAAGGMDERFTGWGGEDDQLHAAVECLVGPPTCHPGIAVSLWHDPACRDIGSARWQPNSELAQRYHRARRDPAAMRALIAERREGR